MEDDWRIQSLLLFALRTDHVILDVRSTRRVGLMVKYGKGTMCEFAESFHLLLKDNL